MSEGSARLIPASGHEREKETFIKVTLQITNKGHRAKPLTGPLEEREIEKFY